MESHCVSFREIPHTTRLYRDFLYDFSRVASFYPYDPFDPDSLARAAEKVPGDKLLRSTVAEVLAEQNRAYGASPATQTNIERLGSGRALAVVTGQQVGLFAGPSYSLYKSLTAIRLAEHLTTQGVPAVPVFWLAGEDHDLAEVNHCFILDGGHRLRRLDHRPAAPPQMRVGEIRLGDGIAEVRQELQRLWSQAPAGVLEALAEAYQPKLTYAEAFAWLLHRLLPDTGVIVLNPLDARLSALRLPLLRRVVEEAEHLQARLLARQRALDQAGYHNQVHVRENATLLFLNVDSARQPVRRRRENFEVAAHGLLSRSELLAELDRHHERVSPNVLLRPLVQDTLLPTVAYVAGPAEVAYLAQAGTLYHVLLGRMPVVFPRASLTLVDRPTERLLRKYGLEPRELFRPRRQVFEQMARATLPRDLQRRLEVQERKLQKLLDETGPRVARVDATLAGAVETVRRKMLYQFHKLEGKAARAYAARSELLARHLDRLCDTLYPENALQERTVNCFSFLARYGLELVPRLSAEIQIPCRDHKVIYLER